jgi:hypothetical protein
MKSFADWTDEIRALMNPPAPMVDTCNLADYEEGFYVPALVGLFDGVTYDAAEQRYTRIGDKVTLHGTVKLPEYTRPAMSADDLRFYSGGSWNKEAATVYQLRKNELYSRMSQLVASKPVPVLDECMKDLMLVGAGAFRVVHDEVQEEIKIEYLDPERLWKL